MSLRKIISKFVTQICEKNYSSADKTLDTILTEKMKNRIGEAKEKIKKDDCGCENCEKKHSNKKNKKTKKVTKKVTKKG